MGFWSSIGSAISSCCSAVSNAVSSACSAIGRAVTSAFEGVMNNMDKIVVTVATLAPVLQALSVAIPQLRPAAMVVVSLNQIMQAFGLAKEGETVEDVGQDVLDAQEAGIQVSDYSTYYEYMEAIRTFKVDNPEYQQGDYSFAEKFASGLAVQSWGLEEKFGAGASGLVVSVLKDAANLEKGEGFLTPERIDSWVKGVTSLADVAKYFAGKLDIDESNKVEQEIIKVEQQQNPDVSLNVIYDKLDQYRAEN